MTGIPSRIGVCVCVCEKLRFVDIYKRHIQCICGRGVLLVYPRLHVVWMLVSSIIFVTYLQTHARTHIVHTHLNTSHEILPFHFPSYPIYPAFSSRSASLNWIFIHVLVPSLPASEPSLIQGILGFYECTHTFSLYQCHSLQQSFGISLLFTPTVFQCSLISWAHMNSTSTTLTCCTWPSVSMYSYSIHICIRNSFKILTRMLGMCSVHTENTLGFYLFFCAIFFVFFILYDARIN